MTRILNRFRIWIAILLSLLSLAAQVPSVTPFPARTTQTTTQDQKAFYAAQDREFEHILKQYSEAENQYALLFNEIMKHRGEIWDIPKARKLVELRTEADRLWDKLINHPLYRK